MFRYIFYQNCNNTKKAAIICDSSFFDIILIRCIHERKH